MINTDGLGDPYTYADDRRYKPDVYFSHQRVITAYPSKAYPSKESPEKQAALKELGRAEVALVEARKKVEAMG